MYNKFLFFIYCYRFLFYTSILLLLSSNVFAGIDWDKWDDSVIRLLVIDQSGVKPSFESGTAFAIDNNGNYITNHHVIATALKGGKIAAVESLAPEKFHKVEIVWESEEYDLAMVHVKDWKKPALTLSSGDLLKKGQDVYSIGFPGAADRDNATEFNVSTLKKGVFSAFKNFPLMNGGQNVKMIEHDAAVNSGNSGGPLADACGRVVGINEQKSLGQVIDQGSQGIAINSAEGILFSINTLELMGLLDKHNVAFNRDDSVCTKTTIGFGNSNLALIIIGLIAALAITGFIFMYRRVQTINGGQFNTRVLSRMIHDRINGSTGETPSPSRSRARSSVRSYFSHNEGRIIHRDEQQPAEAPLAPEPVTPVIPQILYSLVPQHSHSGLPTMTLPSQGSYRLGRNQSTEIQLVLSNQYVSSEHLLITVNPDQSVVVEDLGSMNGTHVSGTRLTQGQIHPLHIGQSLRIGHDDIVYTLQRG